MPQPGSSPATSRSLLMWISTRFLKSPYHLTDTDIEYIDGIVVIDKVDGIQQDALDAEVGLISRSKCHNLHLPRHKQSDVIYNDRFCTWISMASQAKGYQAREDDAR